MKNDKVEQNWHCLSADHILEQLQSSKKGLSASQVKAALSTFGKNQLPEAKPTSITKLFFSQFKEAMTIVLLVAVAISAFLGELTDAIIISIILLLNASLSTYQEHRAQQALLALKKSPDRR